MTSSSSKTERPPIVAVLGHVDHGKSSLLDYIRKTNIVAGEAGGITQHTAAYEVSHTNAAGVEKRITFIDTPGHEAFGAQRARGAKAADIAILVVSAEDGVKAQTKEALSAILAAQIPFIVAVNKIDLPAANVERTLNSLAENEVYLEGRGGSVPYVPVSAKRGDGIPELLEMILLLAEVSELVTDTAKPAEGFVVESHRDPRKGISASFIIQDGTLKKGMAVAAEGGFAPVRAILDFNGAPLPHAIASSPVTIIGWSNLPVVGSHVVAFESKRDAENYANEHKPQTVAAPEAATTIDTPSDVPTALIPLIIKADVTGSIDALKHEIAKLVDDRVSLKVIHADVGTIGENDIKRAGGDERTVVIGFNTGVDAGVAELAERAHVLIKTENIIYKLSEWLLELIAKRRPRHVVEEVHGTVRLLKLFSSAKHKHIIGGRVETGVIRLNDRVSITRRGEQIGNGKIIELQKERSAVKEVGEGGEFGAKLEASIDVAAGDMLSMASMVER